MKSSAFRNGLLVTMSLALICAPGAWAQSAKGDPIKWNLKGSCKELRLESAALVTAHRAPRFFSSPECTPEFEAEHPADPIQVSIPLSSITTIIREVVTREPVQEEINKTLSAVKPENLGSTILEAAGTSGPFAPAAPVEMLVYAGTLAPFRGVKTHIESVRVLWAENGTPRSTILFLSRKKDVESFLNRLAQATGKSRTEVRFGSQAQNQHASQILAYFVEPVCLGDSTVSEGNYRLLIVAASDSTHLVYMFSQETRLPQDAMAVFTADASPLGSVRPWKIRLAHNAEGSWCLSEIDTDLEKLRLRGQSCPAPQL